MPSISVCKGKGSVNHNNREFTTPNVEKSRTQYNITYVKEPLEVAYEKCFGGAVSEYDARQKRKDRRYGGAEGYLHHIEHSKNGEKPFYEIVVQVGNMQDCGGLTPNGAKCRKILDGYMKDFAKQNPNLYVFNAVLHADEKTPHLHIDYIPIAKDYKSGLRVRNSLERALEQQGVTLERAATRTYNHNSVWQEQQKDHIETIMSEYGLERTAETGLKRKHKSVEDYKTTIEVVKNEIESTPCRISATNLPRGKALVNQTDLKELEHRATLTEPYNNAVQALRNAQLGLAQKEKAYQEKYKEQLTLNLSYANVWKKNKELEKRAREAEEKAERAIKAYNFQKGYADKWIGNYFELKDKKENREKELEREKKAAVEKAVSQAWETAEKGNDSKIQALQQEIDSLKAEVATQKRLVNKVCECLRDTLLALNCLPYAKEGGQWEKYRLNLPNHVRNLFVAVETRVLDVLHGAQKDDFVDYIQHHIGVSDDIRQELNKLEPKAKSHDDFCL